jgi:O-methyltransferase involved in polyketide biosynthesis
MVRTGIEGADVTERTPAELTGVPETLLWTLYQRAAEARRPDSALRDARAVQLVEAIDYPFEDRFGGAEFGQWQALRARCFDEQVTRFLAEHRGGTVVALGEGLETQFWRVDDGHVHWLTVDLPEVIELRRRLLPPETPRHRMIGGSALERTWLDEVHPARGLMVTAQGLLMYLQPAEVHRLVTTVAARFPGSTMLLDGVPPWFSARTVKGRMTVRRPNGGYTAPPMPWALDDRERDRLRGLHPGIELTDLRPPRGHALLHGVVFPLLNRIPAVRATGLTGLPIVRLDFTPTET